MAAWLPTLMLILGGVLSAATPQIQHLVAGHPTAAAVAGTVIGIIGHFLPSPAQAQNQSK